MIGEGKSVCMQWPGPRWMEDREVGGGYDRSTAERERSCCTKRLPVSLET